MEYHSWVESPTFVESQKKKKKGKKTNRKESLEYDAYTESEYHVCTDIGSTIPGLRVLHLSTRVESPTFVKSQKRSRRERHMGYYSRVESPTFVKGQKKTSRKKAWSIMLVLNRSIVFEQP